MSYKNLVRRWSPRSLRNWMRMPSRSVSYVLDRLSYAAGHIKEVQVRDGWKPKCHPAAKSHFNVFCNDPVQAAELDAFIENCPSGIQLLDIGAHYGFFAIAAVHYGGANSRVLCVEASPGAAKILHSTLVLNDASEQVTFLNVAMGAEDGYLPMLTTGPLAGDYFIVPAGERADTVMVPQRRLDTVVRETGFIPSHIKIDIEGFEYEVIESSMDLLRDLHPVLFLELHGTALRDRGKDPLAVIRMLQSSGYTRFSHEKNDLTPEMMLERDCNCRLICF